MSLYVQRNVLYIIPINPLYQRIPFWFDYRHAQLLQQNIFFNLYLDLKRYEMGTHINFKWKPHICITIRFANTIKSGTYTGERCKLILLYDYICNLFIRSKEMCSMFRFMYVRIYILYILMFRSWNLRYFFWINLIPNFWWRRMNFLYSLLL